MNTKALMTPSSVLDFWFDAGHRAFWFRQSDDFDQKIMQQFSDLHRQACLGECWQWRETAQGALAEIIVLDQFSRNLYRNDPRAFAQDGMAVALTQQMIRLGQDLQLPEAQRHFAYMPLMHSESALIHQQAVELFKQLGNENVLDFEYRHQKIIEQFGRYPHRNAVLGRQSTEAERLFLQTHHGF